MAHVLRLGHAAQPQAQVACFVTGKHGVTVRQVHRGHAPRTQGVAHSGCFFAGTHQYGDVLGLQGRVCLAGNGEAGLRIAQPGHDLLGTDSRQMGQRITRTAQSVVVHHGQGRNLAVSSHEHFAATAGRNRQERQGVVLAAPVSESVRQDHEPAVDRIDQGLGGSEIGPQHVVPARGRPTGRQVTVDVGPAKAVDRLLGVPDQQQRGVLGVVRRAVDAFENAQLKRRGVLEFVDHGHRELLSQALRQALSCLGVGQRRIQSLQHVGKTELATAALEFGHALQHMGTGVQTCCDGRIGQVNQGLLKIGKGLGFGRQVHRWQAGFAAGQQTLRREAGPARVFHVAPERRGIIRPHCPCLENRQPLGAFFGGQLAAVPAGLVMLELGLDPAPQVVGLFVPAFLEGLELRLALRLGGGKHLCQRTGCGAVQGYSHQCGHVLVEGGHVTPDALQLLHKRHGHGIQVHAPIVLNGLQAQRRFVADQVFLEQAAAVKSVLAQHPLAPGIDREDGCVIHGLGCQCQPVGSLLARLALGVGVFELHNEGIASAGRVTKHLRRLAQPGADTVRELAGGGAGEGHHQHILRKHGTHRGAALAAMAQHQTQVQRCDRPGLSRACACLDQVAAAQYKSFRIEGVCLAHADRSSVRSEASSRTSMSACSAQSLSGR